LQRGQQPGQVADQPPGLAPGELGHVRVLLLRHDRAAGGEGVVEGDVAELGGRPEDHLLGDPGQVDGGHRQHERRLGREVAGRGAVDGVGRRRVEPELGGHRLGVEAQRRPGQRARPVRRDRGPLVPVAQPVDVAQQGVRVRGQVVREQHRLGVLQVRPPGHRGVRVRRGLRDERVDDVQDAGADPARGVAQPHPEQGGHLVVAGAPGA
jgi:hypothetical protein